MKYCWKCVKHHKPGIILNNQIWILLYKNWIKENILLKLWLSLRECYKFVDIPPSLPTGEGEKRAGISVSSVPITRFVRSSATLEIPPLFSAMAILIWFVFYKVEISRRSSLGLNPVYYFIMELCPQCFCL